MKLSLWLLMVLLSVSSIHLTAQEGQPAKTNAPAPNTSSGGTDKDKAGAGQGGTETPTSVSCDKLPNVAPEQVLTLTSCSDLDEKDGTVLFKRPETTPLNAPGQVDPKKKTLTFQVSGKATPGPYSLTVGGKPIDGQLEVMEPVEVTGIYPGTTYQGQKGFDFKIAGKNFSNAPSAEPGEPPVGNLIEIVGGGMLRKCKPETPVAAQYPCATDISSATNEIAVTGFTPKHYYGPVNVVVHVGKSASKPISVTFAQVSQPGVVLAAAAVFFIVAYILYRLVTKGIKGDIINGVQLTPWSSLFLDPQTNSYSLSKFQVMAWTTVTVYSYVYIFLCRTLIQGNFNFPDVPQNLPQLFFVSAGTTVAAAAITATVGSKGAGPIQPSASDFISTGGLVAGDRFQFFTWTIVGCIGYVYLVIRMNPETPNISLPDIPQNFLYLMGVSSAGYLGGKVVRKPGPVIKVLSVAKVTSPDGILQPTPTPAANQDQARTSLGIFQPGAQNASLQVAFPVLTINVKGENLDPTGKIKVGDETLRGDMFWINGTPNPQSGFCSEINVSLNGATKYLDGNHTLTLVNTDGQSATANFPVDPMTIDPVPNVIEGSPISLNVTGKNFSNGTRAEWRNPSDSLAPTIPAAQLNVNVDSPGQLKITGPRPGAPGTGKLTLISPIQLRMSASVAVEPMISPIPDLAAGQNNVPVTVHGNFVQNMTFEWRNPATAPQPTQEGDVAYVSPTEITVTLTPGAAGAARLTLRLPDGTQASVNVTVK